MMPSSAKPSRSILLRTVAVIVGLVAALVALAAGILAPYYLSVHIARTSLLTLTAIVAFGVIAWLGMRLSAALWRTDKPARLAVMTSGGLTVVFIIALYFLILRPLPLRYTDVVAAENGKYWHLPNGTTISYQEFLPPSGTEVKPDPIVFLHGGPGLRFGPFDSDIYSVYAADGFRVYLYDQTGSGASTRLRHVRDYTPGDQPWQRVIWPSIPPMSVKWCFILQDRFGTFEILTPTSTTARMPERRLKVSLPFA